MVREDMCAGRVVREGSGKGDREQSVAALQPETPCSTTEYLVHRSMRSKHACAFSVDPVNPVDSVRVSVFSRGLLPTPYLEEDSKDDALRRSDWDDGLQDLHSSLKPFREIIKETESDGMYLRSRASSVPSHPQRLPWRIRMKRTEGRRDRQARFRGPSKSSVRIHLEWE